MPRLSLLILMLCGCDGIAPPLASGPGETERGSAFDCPASDGAPRIELCDGSADHRPMEDGSTYDVRVMPQGFTVIMSPVWFGGIEGGELVDLRLEFETDDGELIGERDNRNFKLPCDDNDNVAAEWMDTILPPGTQSGEYDGVSGTLLFTVELDDGTVLTDDVHAVLDHPDD